MEKFLANYLTQKTTWIGLFTILGTLGISLGDKLTEAICTLCVAIFGLVLVILDERRKSKED